MAIEERKEQETSFEAANLYRTCESVRKEKVKEMLPRLVSCCRILFAMPIGSPTHGVSRARATLHQVGNDLVEGIEGKDLLTEPILGVRNAAVGIFHAVQGVIPSAANAFSNQKYSVVRRDSPYQGTANSVDKIIHTRGILGKASAVLAEATDGPVDDAISATTGGAQWMVVPRTAA